MLLNATEYLATPVPADTVNVPALLIMLLLAPPLSVASDWAANVAPARLFNTALASTRLVPPLHVAAAWLFSTP